LAEQKALQHQKFMRDMMNSVFFGQRINEHQTVEAYRSLPGVVDPANPECTLEYKANALGLETQLSDCSRIDDLVGAALSLDNLASAGYDLKRAREASSKGAVIDRIEFGTDRYTKGRIFDTMVSFYKAKYGVNLERHYQPNQKLTFRDQVELTYDVFQLPSELGGYELAIWTHPYFDDKLNAFATASAPRGRLLYGVDWSDFTLGIAGSTSVQRQTNVADNLYNCVIKPNINHYQLSSTKFCPIIEDPARHKIIKNFSDSCPSLTVQGCSV
jgi:hypothetical protein